MFFCCIWVHNDLEVLEKKFTKFHGGLRSQRGKIQNGRWQGHLMKNIPEYRQNGKDAPYYTQFYSGVEFWGDGPLIMSFCIG